MAVIDIKENLNSKGRTLIFFFCLNTQSSSAHCQTEITGQILPQVLDETRKDINKRPKGHIAHLQLTQVAEQNSPCQW